MLDKVERVRSRSAPRAALELVHDASHVERVLNEPKALGLLYTAESVGTLLATVTSGWTSRFHHHGRAVVVASMCW